MTDDGFWKNRIIETGAADPQELAKGFNPLNWRGHPESQREALEEALDSIGVLQPVLFNKLSGRVIDGHLRIELAILKGQPLIPVNYVELTDDEEALALATLDAITEQAEPIAGKLAALMERTRQMTDDKPGLRAMLDRLKERAGIVENGHESKDAEPKIDKAAELQKVWNTAVGQVWELGNHRLAVGDCTDRAVVEAVMRGERADTLFTDPPYNVGREYTEATDDNRTSEDYKNWTHSWVGAAFGALKDDADIFVTPGHRYYLQTTGVLCEFGKYVWTIAWIKTNSMMRSPTGFNTWEPISWIKNGAPVGYGNKRYDTLNVPMVMDETTSGHPTPKPLNLLLELFKIKGEKIETVFDSFLGSGTTLIACEQLAHRCRGVEISPGYAAVSIQRWVDLTGGEPRLLTG